MTENVSVGLCTLQRRQTDSFQQLHVELLSSISSIPPPRFFQAVEELSRQPVSSLSSALCNDRREKWSQIQAADVFHNM